MACKSRGTFRAHQVPLLVDAEHPEHVKQLESWMKSYKAEELFDKNGRLMPELAELAPKGDPADGCQSPHQRRPSCYAICACRIFTFTR